MPEPNRHGRSIIFAQTARVSSRSSGSNSNTRETRWDHDQDIKAFCAGLIALPRPVPIADLAAVTGLNEAYIRDLCADFAPGVRLTNGSIGFADEDFEHFVRTEAEPQLRLIQSRMADHFFRRHRSDAYAAAHVAEALLVAGRGGRSSISLTPNGSRRRSAIRSCGAKPN